MARCLTGKCGGKSKEDKIKDITNRTNKAKAVRSATKVNVSEYVAAAKAEMSK